MCIYSPIFVTVVKRSFHMGHNMQKTFVAYYRVSTQKQGASGLGLDAQKTAVANYVDGRKIVHEVTEIESGKKSERVGLAEAIKIAQQTNSTLIVAKLDRLSRDVKFIFALRDSGVDFICADMPEANTLTIGIFAVMAQHERELISKRTKDGLAEAKRRGVVLGTPENLTDAARSASIATRTALRLKSKEWQRARALAVSMRPTSTLRQIASTLNDNGYTTRNGKQFGARQVLRLLEMPEAIA
jgi:DNA invertase Pin-like site-specific DNA recombinase